jgi:hypothetical protein
MVRVEAAFRVHRGSSIRQFAPANNFYLWLGHRRIGRN